MIQQFEHECVIKVHDGNKFDFMYSYSITMTSNTLQLMEWVEFIAGHYSGVGIT